MGTSPHEHVAHKFAIIVYMLGRSRERSYPLTCIVHTRTKIYLLGDIVFMFHHNSSPDFGLGSVMWHHEHQSVRPGADGRHVFVIDTHRIMLTNGSVTDADRSDGSGPDDK